MYYTEIELLCQTYNAQLCENNVFITDNRKVNTSLGKNKKITKVKST